MVFNQSVKINLPIYSPKKKYNIIFEPDSNIGIHYGTAPTPIWKSSLPTSTKNPSYIILNNDATISCFDSANTEIWTSPRLGIAGTAPYTMCFTDEGNLCICDSLYAMIWSSMYSSSIVYGSPSANVVIPQNLSSPSKKCFLTLQTDGNLVLYMGTPTSVGVARWSSGCKRKQ